MKQGKKSRKITLKKGGKASKMHQQAYLSVKHNESQKRGRGEMIKMHNTYPCVRT